MSEQPEAQVFSTSVKIDTTAKGQAVVTVHVYGNDDETTRMRAIHLYQTTLDGLKRESIAIAMEVVKS